MNWNLPQNPFVGLRPFEAEESLLFFGRGAQTRELMQQLHASRFLAVVGGSGCGKSSLIRAGLIPKLHGGFLVEDRDVWLVARMKPGDAPILNLAAALLDATGRDDPAQYSGRFAEDIREQGLPGILAHLAPYLEKTDANLLVLVDQFEELFRFGVHGTGHHQNEAAADFVALMLGLAEQRNMPVYVAMTMRSDFLGDCDIFLGLPEAMNRSQYLVPRLTRQQRREAIEGPVRLYRGDITSRLTDRILNETGEARDDLPVLQHALMRTWTVARQNGEQTLDMPHYEAVGTISQALSRHAEEALQGMDNQALTLAGQIFQSLTEVDAGNRAIRRPAKLNEIEAVTGADQEVIWRSIQKFRDDGRSFLVLSSENPPDNPLIDISHESLIRQWDRLRGWVTDEAQSAKIYLRLVETALLHNEGQAGYYRNPDLQIALNWQEQRQPGKTWAERYHPAYETAMAFLEKSRQAHAAEMADKEARRRRQLRRTRLFALSLGIAFLIAVGFFVYALEQRNQAVDQKKRAQEQTAKAEDLQKQANFNLAKVYEEKAGTALRSEEYQKTWLYTLEALNQDIGKKRRIALSLGRLLLPEIRPSTSWKEKKEKEIIRAEMAVWSVAVSPDGNFLAAGGSDKSVRLWGTAGGGKTNLKPGFMVTERFLTHLKKSRFPAKLVDGLRKIVNQRFDAEKTLKNALKAAVGAGLFSQYQEPLLKQLGIGDDVWSVAFSPDGTHLAAGYSDARIYLWDVQTRKEIGRLESRDNAVRSVVFSPDGKRLAAGAQNGGIRLWDLDRLAESARLTGHMDAVLSVVFSPDGKNLASAGADHTIRIWDAAAAKEMVQLSAPDAVNSIVFSPDGRWLIGGCDDWTIRIWETATGQEGTPLAGHSGPVLSVTFSPDGKYLASGSADNTVRLWQADKEYLLAVLPGHASAINSVAFSPDGLQLISGSADQSIRRMPFTVRLFDDIAWDVGKFIDSPQSEENVRKVEQIHATSFDKFPYQLVDAELVAKQTKGANQVIAQAASQYFGAVSLALQEKQFEFLPKNLIYYSANNKGYPKVNGREMTLIPVNHYSAAQVVFFKSNAPMPFEIEFEYSIYDQDGGSDYGSRWHSADGLVFMFLKNRDAYKYKQPPAGVERGVIDDGTGYGVHFAIYGNRTVELKNPAGKILGSSLYYRRKEQLPDVYTHGQWRKVIIRVTESSVMVNYADHPVISWSGKLDTAFRGIGFGAGTGGANGEHKIRNVKISPLMLNTPAVIIGVRG